MDFDWREYLNLARCLDGDRSVRCGAEARQRAAVSRAYYAAFCHARNHALRHNLASDYQESARAHRQVWETYRRHDRDVARHLDDLRHWRNDCDYDDAVPGLAQMCDEALSAAQAVVDRLKPTP